MNIISVKNLSKDFGQERVLKSVTRDFEKGKIHGIVGNNGSGNRALVGTKKAKEALEVFFSHRGIRRRSL